MNVVVHRLSDAATDLTVLGSNRIIHEFLNHHRIRSNGGNPAEERIEYTSEPVTFECFDGDHFYVTAAKLKERSYGHRRLAYASYDRGTVDMLLEDEADDLSHFLLNGERDEQNRLIVMMTNVPAYHESMDVINQFTDALREQNHTVHFSVESDGTHVVIELKVDEDIVTVELTAGDFIQHVLGSAFVLVFAQYLKTH